LSRSGEGHVKSPLSEIGFLLISVSPSF